MTDIRTIPHYYRCDLHPGATGGDGLDCLPCSDARDAAVDALVEAVRRALRVLERTAYGETTAKLRKALAPFGGER